VLGSHAREHRPSGTLPDSGHKMRPHMPAPPAFTDEQIDAIMSAAEPLAPADRTPFLEAVASALQGQEIGDGKLYRVLREIQPRYLESEHAVIGSKWTRS
jgi:hypothetical protein